MCLVIFFCHTRYDSPRHRKFSTQLSLAFEQMVVSCTCSVQYQSLDFLDRLDCGYSTKFCRSMPVRYQQLAYCNWLCIQLMTHNCMLHNCSYTQRQAHSHLDRPREGSSCQGCAGCFHVITKAAQHVSVDRAQMELSL